jgi:hypothetical protein
MERLGIDVAQDWRWIGFLTFIQISYVTLLFVTLRQVWTASELSQGWKVAWTAVLLSVPVLGLTLWAIRRSR